jgi:hypothetical protein
MVSQPRREPVYDVEVTGKYDGTESMSYTCKQEKDSSHRKSYICEKCVGSLSYIVSEN